MSGGEEDEADDGLEEDEPGQEQQVGAQGRPGVSSEHADHGEAEPDDGEQQHRHPEPLVNGNGPAQSRRRAQDGQAGGQAEQERGWPALSAVWKLWPHPHVLTACGLWMVKPPPMRAST